MASVLVCKKTSLQYRIKQTKTFQTHDTSAVYSHDKTNLLLVELQSRPSDRPTVHAVPAPSASPRHRRHHQSLGHSCLHHHHQHPNHHHHHHHQLRRHHPFVSRMTTQHIIHPQKVKCPDIYIPPLTETRTAAVFYKLKCHTDQQ